MKNHNINVLDLFSGCWGLTEWFLKHWYNFIWHIEKDKNSCESLKTRLLYHKILSYWKKKDYNKYHKWEISREKLINKYDPEWDMSSIYNEEISDITYANLLKKIKDKLNWKKLHIIIWGPPCQTYSHIGRARNNKENDPRNFLYKFYINFLRDLKPDVFIFENVPWLKNAGNWKYLDNIKKEMSKVGYELEVKEQYMPDFGIPQNRTRLIIIWRNKHNTKINSYPDLSKYKTEYSYKVYDFLKDLPEIESGWWNYLMEYREDNTILKKLGIRDKHINFVTSHITRSVNKTDKEIYRIAVKKYYKGEKLKYNELPEYLRKHNNQNSFLNRFNVVAGEDKITSTVMAHIWADWHYYIHPDLKQNRSISVREAARLQSFPDNFKFEWSRTSVFKQIGNAVPPMFSEILAGEFLKYF